MAKKKERDPNRSSPESRIRPVRPSVDDPEEFPGGNIDDRHGGKVEAESSGTGGSGGYSNRAGGVDATAGASGADAPGYGDWARQGGYSGTVPGDEGTMFSEKGAYGELLDSPEQASAGAGTGTGAETTRRPSDEELTRLARERLAGHPGLDDAGIEVQVRDGMAILRGAVPTSQIRRLVEDAVAAVPGIEDIADELQVTADGRRDVEVRRGEEPSTRGVSSETRAATSSRPEAGRGDLTET